MTSRRRKWKLGPGTTIWKECKKNIDTLETGTILCLDPSCGSQSSLPGYAVYRAGELLEAGVIELHIHRELPYRLQELHGELLSLTEDFHPDILVIERIPARRYGGGGASGHQSLLNAEGLMLGSVGADRVIRVRPQVWHSFKPEGYEKSDDGDAIQLGHAVLEICRNIRKEKEKGDSKCKRK